jgi:threonylcarbamoyladenosine tRNA methylthiotransferase MtaB
MYARGLREVVLSGVHLGGYGQDLDPPVALEDLLEMLAERSPMRRLRLSSLDPEELSDRIIDIVAENDCFCPHFHLPLQSGHDSTLLRMRRRYDTRFFRGRVERILDKVPEASIGTDLIVGFPGETVEHFNSYFNFVRELPFAYFHVFPYSVRQNTTAAKLDGRVNPVEIRRRAEAMRELGETKKADFTARFAHARLKVLLEEWGRDKVPRGLSRNYIRIAADCEAPLSMDEVDFQASHVDGSTLVGSIVRREAGADECSHGPGSSRT